MSIAYLISQYPAASHTFIRREVEALRLQGVTVETFSIRRPSVAELTSPQDCEEFQKTYYVLPFRFIEVARAHSMAIATRPLRYFRVFSLALSHRVPGLRALLWAIFHFVEAIQLARELERRRVGHLHNHFGNAGATVGLLASTFLKLPWSLTLHGISETDYPAGLLLSDKIAAAQFVACVSHFGRAQAMRVTPAKLWDKFIIVRCAIDFEKLPYRIGPRDRHRPRFVCVGRLSPEKGHLGLLMAFSNVLSRGGNAELVLIGSGPEKASIEQKISDLGLTNSVSLTGLLNEDETLCEIANADALVMASFMEGLPVVLIEAMALTVPVIAPRVAGIPELVNDGENGILFSPSNWDELTEKMLQLLGDPVLRKRLGKAGKNYVLDSFEIGQCVIPLKKRFTTTSQV